MVNHPNRNWRRRAIDRAVAVFRAARDHMPPGEELQVSLIIYPDDLTFLRHRLADWPQLKTAAAHAEFVREAVAPELEAEGAHIRFVMFNPASYAHWLGAHEDSDMARAAEQP